jgi:hypothetical protein
MSTDFVADNIWPQLKLAAKSSRQRCAVAVAFLGKGGSNLLPLPPGSKLVVDASKHSVASGRVCPADLIKFVKRGVDVFSVPNLHAKVFVIGRTAYVGSTNISNNSASNLVEAVIRTTDPVAVQAARKFVADLCFHQLSPKILEMLSKIYRPPKFPEGAAKGASQGEASSGHPVLPRLVIARLKEVDWSDEDQELHDNGLKAANNHRKHLDGFVIDSFKWKGNHPYKNDDVVVQVTTQEDGRIFVAPPGNFLHAQTKHKGNRSFSIIFLERPNRNRRQVKAMAQQLNYDEKLLLRNGKVRNQPFARALLSAWSSAL